MNVRVYRAQMICSATGWLLFIQTMAQLAKKENPYLMTITIMFYFPLEKWLFSDAQN